MAGWILGIDFGTTTTTAATANGRLDVVTIDGSPRVPSTVVVDDDGALFAGVAAEREATVAPERAERTPKRRLGDRLILLGDHAIAPVDAVAAVLRFVVDEATRRHGGEPPSEVRLTHPVTWAQARLDLLRDAAARAGLPSVELIAEPIAAATQLSDGRIADGEHVAVYDLGGGT
ncbi:MAG TPA: Hsp70 family protein, partial [Acidimicrobiales bacterium]